MNTTKFIPGTDVPMPDELAQIIATHTSLTGGFQMKAETGDYVSRLSAQIDEATDAIDEITQRAAAEDRNLTDAEDSEITQLEGQLDALKPQLERMSRIRQKRSETVTIREQMPENTPVPEPKQRGQRDDDGTDEVSTRGSRQEYTSGSYVMDLFRSSRGDVQARERVQRALSKVTTGDTPGLLPIQTVGDLRGKIEGPRPLVNIATKIPLPASGMQFRRPKITDHTSVGKQTTEKTEVASSAFKVGFDAIDLITFAGAVNISIQDVERSDPGALDLVFQDLAAQYGLATEKETADQLVAAVKQTQDLADDADNAAILKAVFTAAGVVYEGSQGQHPDTLVCSVDQWGRFGAMSTPINPQNQVIAGSPTSFSLSAAGITAVVSPQLPEGFAAIGRRDTLEVIERPGSPVQLSATEPRILGMELGVYGLFASYVANPAAWVKLSVPAAG